MDALSMLLEDVHLFQTEYFYVRGQGQWSFYLDKKDCIVFYLVVKGGLNLTVAETAREAVASDIVMVPGGRNHVVKSMIDKSMATDADVNDAIDLAPFLVKDASHPIQVGKLDKSNEDNLSEFVVIVCHYDHEITRPLLLSLPNILPEHQGREEQKMMMLDIGTKFLALESAQNRLGKTTIINRLASILMIECVRTYIEDLPEATENWLKALKDPYLAKAFAVMHDRPDFNWTIHRLAEVAGMSRSSFAEHFREVVGEPPLTYLTDYRLRLAARYLRLQENSISRISELVGYASDSTFSQAFKRVYGMSPRKYRQQFRNDDEN
ncbi:MULTISPECIES: AraC family transcriptional regulator [unclassified Moraxella]|uniref:AraC family transcriptional regulator n=1 Tax=unclassified Moraxella TaxID=2685852 RepID=UPI003AF5BBC5